MPLTEQATFKTRLQRHNRLTVPRQLRWLYKLEPTQLLRVTVQPVGAESFGEQEEFLAKMAADGRLTIPKLIMEIFHEKEENDLTGCIFQVTIYPAAEEPSAPPPAPAKSSESTETNLLGKIDNIRKSLHDTTN